MGVWRWHSNLTNRLYGRQRRYRVDDKPVQLATSYFPAHIVAGTRITEPDTGRTASINVCGSWGSLRCVGWRS